MVAPVPFSIPPIKVQIATVRKVDRKPNPRNEEKYNEKNRQAQREKDRLSQSTSVGQNGKKVDLLLQLFNQTTKIELSFLGILQWTAFIAEPPHIFDNLGTVEVFRLLSSSIESMASRHSTLPWVQCLGLVISIIYNTIHSLDTHHQRESTHIP